MNIMNRIEITLSDDLTHGTMLTRMSGGKELVEPVVVGDGLETLTVGSAIYRHEGGWTELRRWIPGTRRVFSEDGQSFSEILLSGHHRLVTRLDH